MEIFDIRNQGAAQGALEKHISARPALDTGQLENTVSEILKEVKERGDEAVKKFSKRFDQSSPEELRVSEAEVAAAAPAVSENLRKAIRQAAANIETFHRGQVQVVNEMETMPGIRCWRKSVAIEKVGLYIPGGTAPLFSTLLMLGIPAKIAGCRQIILCTPPSRDGAYTRPSFLQQTW